MADPFFSTNTGIGLSLLRNRVAPDGSASASEIGLMMKAQARGAKVWSTPWSPPAAFKDSGSVNGGKYLGGAATNRAYANQLAAYVLNMKTNYGINLYALSIQNEPNYSTTNYESCVWNATQFHNFVPLLYNALSNNGVASTRIMMPEDSVWQATNLYTTAMNDTNTAAEVGIIANHNYLTNNLVGDQTTPAVLPAYGKALWETEVSTLGDVPDASITNAMYWAGRIHLFLTAPQVNAWHYWWLISYDDNAGLEIQSGSIPTKRMYVLGQYSRFVRPGYYRIDAGGGSALVSAYNDTNSGNFAIVAVNTNNSTAISQTFILTNFPTVNSVTPWITSAALSLSNQPAVTVSNLSFSYTLPALSVVTFVGQGRTTSSSIITSNCSYIPGGPYFVLTWNATTGATYSVRSTNVLTGSATDWPVLVTGYPAGGAVAGPLSYTDTMATASPAFYRVSSP